ncbi:MAG: CBS domain-containing protein [Actinobacteria bacterium]|nr:CBS domain-containing protein [Actinomycetota bacterium]
MPEQTLVTEVMTTDVVTLRPDQSPAEVADVFAEHGIGAAPVVDDAGNVIGLLRDEDLLVTEARLHVPTTIAILPGVEFTFPGDIRRYDEELKRAAASTAADLMERDYPKVRPDATIEDLATLMHERDVTHVVVQDDGVAVGIVARGDLVRFLARST